MKKLWEILVPNYSNKGIKYSLDYHHGWDDKVREISGGLTILKPAKGHWKNQTGKLFVEEMIPIRIYCSEEEIEKIIDLTLHYYDQETVMAYEISSHVKIKHRQS